jgi:RNA polymerase sigma factor (TIGR02999 family)
MQFMSSPADDVTQLLHAIDAGQVGAAERLLPLVYDELRRLAQARLGGRSGHTLQATALVHEAYLRLFSKAEAGWESRGHFFFAAARAIHDILVESARRKAAQKRGGDRRKVDLGMLEIASEAPAEDMLALAEALEILGQEDPQAHRLVLLRFFAGLSEEQSAEVLGMSERTLRREWRYARARLHELLGQGA